MPLSKERSELTAETSDPIGVRDLLRPPVPPFYRVGVRAATWLGGTGLRASLPLEDSRTSPCLWDAWQLRTPTQYGRSG